MNLQEDLKATGKLTISVFDKDGKLKQVTKHNNLVVTVGKQYIASRMAADTAEIMNTMAIGTGTASPAAGDTALGTEANRQATTSFTASGATVTASATFAAGEGTGAITEAGIFNPGTAGASGGTMLCRTTFPVVTKGSGDSIAINWTITVS